MPARGEPVSGDGPASYIYGSEAVESIKGLGTQGPGRLKTTQPATKKESESQSSKHAGPRSREQKVDQELRVGTRVGERECGCLAAKLLRLACLVEISRRFKMRHSQSAIQG